LARFFSVTSVEYDPFSPETLADPAAAHAVLLAGCPVHRFDGWDPPFYSLSRYEDVAAALRDVETFSSRYGQGPRYQEQRGMQSDAPDHTFFRRLVQKAFTPKAVAAMEPRVEVLVEGLLDAIADRGEADLHETLAYPLPTIVIAEMLGVPAADREAFKRWSDAQVAAMGEPDPNAFAQERKELRAYLHGQVEERRKAHAAGRALPADLVAALVVAEEDGIHLDDEGILNVLVQLLVGGNETTTSLITNAVLRLTENDLWGRLRADQGLVDVAVEESLRYDSPVIGLFRTTTRPVTLRDVTIPSEAKVMLLYAAANRDPEAWPDPEQFSLDRDVGELRRRHLAFGLGVHVCLGAALSRLEARIVLAQIAERLPGLRITGPTERIRPFLLWGRRTLPVAWDPT
jgi:cytochrome P450